MKTILWKQFLVEVVRITFSTKFYRPYKPPNVATSPIEGLLESRLTGW